MSYHYYSFIILTGVNEPAFNIFVNSPGNDPGSAQSQVIISAPPAFIP